MLLSDTDATGSTRQRQPSLTDRLAFWSVPHGRRSGVSADGFYNFLVGNIVSTRTEPAVFPAYLALIEPKEDVPVLPENGKSTLAAAQLARWYRQHFDIHR